MERYYLMPCARQNQKSFGCNAVVEVMDDGTKVLYSYMTKVAKIVRGRYIFRICGHDMKYSSPTTMRHLVAFCVNNGLEPITKKAWNAMPTISW